MKAKILIFLAMIFMVNSSVYAGFFKQDPVTTALCMDNDLLAYATDFAKNRNYYEGDSGEYIIVSGVIVIGKWSHNPVLRKSWVRQTSAEFSLGIIDIVESLPRNLPPKVIALKVRQACLDGKITPTFGNPPTNNGVQK